MSSAVAWPLVNFWSFYYKDFVLYDYFCGGPTAVAIMSKHPLSKTKNYMIFTCSSHWIKKQWEWGNRKKKTDSLLIFSAFFFFVVVVVKRKITVLRKIQFINRSVSAYNWCHQMWFKLMELLTTDIYCISSTENCPI